MAYHQEWQITAIKESQRQLQTPVLQRNLATLLSMVNTRGAYVQGFHVEADLVGMPAARWWQNDPDRFKRSKTEPDWTSDITEGLLPWAQVPERKEHGHTCVNTLFLKLVYHQENGKAPNEDELATMFRTIHSRLASGDSGIWEMATVDGAEYEPPTRSAVLSKVAGYGEVKIPADFEDKFSHLYGLDYHIMSIKARLEAGIDDDWLTRLHVALVGDPGCGKSDICRTLKTMLGDEAVLEWDATATTGAGAIKQLTDLDVLPRVIIIEEIEKQDQKQLAFFLALMDNRAEIRKTTARTQVQRETRIFVICTVNNFKLFQTVQAGALVSRFNEPIFFHRPSRQQLEMILRREVARVAGDLAWIEPTLNWCDRKKISDPRRAIALCLMGKNKWLTEGASGRSVMEEMLMATGPEAYSHEPEEGEDDTVQVETVEEDFDYTDDEVVSE